MTGALGREVEVQLAQRGCVVAIADINGDRYRDRRRIDASGVETETIVGDFSLEGAPRAGGGIAILVNNVTPSMQVANLALAHGSYIAPHQSGGPAATAVCLQLAAVVPNFLIQEHFDAFNDPWTRDLVTWHPTVNPNNGHLSLPDAPGLGIDLNIDAIKDHPYDPNAYLNVRAEGWEKRLGRREETTRESQS